MLSSAVMLLPSLLFLLNLCPISAQDAIQVSKLQSDCGTLYTVVAGDSCFAIANSAKITTAQLASLNPDLNCTTVVPGDGLCLGVPCGKTYAVQSGDWCAKIATEQGTTEDLLATLNPGLVCADLFAGQVVCVASPAALPPPSTDPVPALPPEGVPTVACRTFLPVSLNDTCTDISDEWGIQLSQFSSMNGNLNCTSLQPGTTACVFPACEQVYKVQQGDSCSQIELSTGLASGQLANLNPGLACGSLFPNQNLCVEPPVEKPASDPGTFSAWKKYPVLSSGDLPKSPLVSFAQANDSRETFFGDVLFKLDSQHREVFGQVDLNNDGRLDKSELDTLYATYPHMSNGIAQLDDTLTDTNFVENMIKSADINGDGAIDLSEFMAAVFSAQNLTTANLDTTFQASATNGLQKRIIPFLLNGVGGLFGLIAISHFADMMAAMEIKARADAGDLLNYLDVTYWDRGNEPEPKCAAYMYYSSSCAALGNSWSSHCSEGGEKVYEESCRGLFTNGAKACGFLGCSSLCYKINTENCDCDALKYTTETHRDYANNPASRSQETGVGGCRNKCRGLLGCVGFTVSAGNDDSHITCKVFTSMNSPQTVDRAVAFKLVGPPVGSGTNPICPRIPDGYYPVSPDQMVNNEMIGEQLSDQYSDYLAGRSLVARQANAYDPRGTYAMYIKDQGNTGTCASHTFSTMVEGSIQKQYNRQTFLKPISPAWIHHCRLWLDKQAGTNFDLLTRRVSDSYIATEDCMQMKDWLDDGSPNCYSNGCAKSQYGLLPYVTKYSDFTSPKMNPQMIQAAQDHIRNVGPLFMGFYLPTKFHQYALDLSRGTIPKNEVYYDNHPRYRATPRCQWGGHAMAAVGYGYYFRQGTSRRRLYWIIQNSWGAGSGDNGYVYVEYGSLSSAIIGGPQGVNVKEGTQWFFNDIPPYNRKDEL